MAAGWALSYFGEVKDAEDLVFVDVDGRRVECRPDRPLLNELMNAGVLVESACGGRGSCHLCRVLVSGPVEPENPTAAEKHGLGNVLIAMNMRLACQISARPNLQVQIADRARRRRRKAAATRRF